MKLTKQTLQFIENFQQINPSIKFLSGNVMRTCSPLKTIYARANLDQEIEKDFSIYDLTKFMSALSLFNDPDIDLDKDSATITDGNKKIKYTYCSENTITIPSDKDVNLPSKDIKFQLTDEMLKSVTKASSVLKLPNIAVVGEDGKLFFKAFNVEDTTDNVYTLDIGETDQEFVAVFNKDSFDKLIAQSYDVTISNKGLSEFKSSIVVYWVALIKKESKF